MFNTLQYNYLSIFHHPSWFSVLQKTYGFQIKIIGDNNSYGIPFYTNNKKYVSLPFSDYVKILTTKEETDRILRNLILKNSNVSIEIRDKYEGEGFEHKLVGYTHSLSLIPSEEDIFRSFKKTQVQQPIQQAIKNGLYSVIRRDIEAINEFYRLHLLTRKRLGVPIQPKRFFYNLFNEIIQKNLGFITLVYLENQVISAGIFCGYGHIMTYKYSASDYNFLKFRPNNLMLWEAIKEAKRRSFEVFDFGRTELENEGLRKFKLGWGTKEELLYYSFYPKAPSNSKFIFVKNNIVAPIIRKSPKFICRLTGELFYKYFG